jgi:hypothetical protein
MDGMLTDGKNQVLILACSQQFERRWLGYLAKGYQFCVVNEEQRGEQYE